MVPPGSTVLDVACGGGRHTRFFLALGHPVVAVDADASGVHDLAGHPCVEVIEADLEVGDPVPFRGRRFGAVVVTNYLHRPILGDIVDAVDAGGMLLYETFAAGNERFGRPRRADFLLQPGELLDAVRGALRVMAYEDLFVGDPPRAAVQRIAATRP
jgi:SAM-dependent methyltransferase